MRSHLSYEDVHRGMPALELADAFIADTTGTDDAERTRAVILCAAELIADRGAPGRWESFDAAAYRGRVDFLDEHALVGEFLVLAGFIGWLTLVDLMARGDAVAILEDLAAAGPRVDLLQGFCQRSMRLLAGH